MDISNPYINNQSWPVAPVMPMAQRPVYGSWPMQPNYGMQPQTQAQAPSQSTNIDRVTGLEEALFKSTVRNSDMVYFDQAKPVIYRVKVDSEGVKSWAQLSYTLPEQAASVPATKADIQALENRLAALEKAKELKAVAPKKKKVEEEIDDGESN